MVQKHTQQLLLRSRFKALEEDVTLFSKMIKQQTNGVILLDKEKRIQFFNPKAKKLLNKYYTLKLGEYFFLIDKVDSKNKVSIDGSLGKTILIEIISTLIQMNENTFYLLNISDLTEFEETKKAYQETKERLNLAIAVSDLGLWEYDYKDDTTRVDANYAAIFGYSLKEFPGEGIFFKSVHPKESPNILKSWNMLLLGETALYDEIFRVVNRKGEWRWVHARAKISKRDENGIPYRFLGTIQDISRRKYSEIELGISYRMSSIASERIELKDKIKEILSLLKNEFDIQTNGVILFNKNRPDRISIYKGYHPARYSKWNTQKILALKESIFKDNQQNHPVCYDEFVDLDVGIEEPERTGQLFNIVLDGKTIGCLVVFLDELRSFNEFENSIFASVSKNIGTVVEKNILSEMADNSVKAEERQRLARELHDSVNQSLYSISLMVNGARDYAVNGDEENVLKIFSRLGETIRQTQKDMRLLIYELKPSVLGEEGLAKALQQRAEMLEKNSQIKTVLQIDFLPSFSAEVESEIFGIVQEALNNVLKHSNANKVTIHLFRKEKRFHVLVQDNGIGFNSKVNKDYLGMGLMNIYERSKRIGGTLQINSKIDKGTKILLRIPLGGE